MKRKIELRAGGQIPNQDGKWFRILEFIPVELFAHSLTPVGRELVVGKVRLGEELK